MPDLLRLFLTGRGVKLFDKLTLSIHRETNDISWHIKLDISDWYLLFDHLHLYPPWIDQKQIRIILSARIPHQLS